MKRILIPILAIALSGCFNDKPAAYAKAAHFKTATVEILTSDVVNDTEERDSKHAQFTYFIAKAPSPSYVNSGNGIMVLNGSKAMCILKNSSGDLAGGTSIPLDNGDGGMVDFAAPNATPGGTLTCIVK